MSVNVAVIGTGNMGKNHVRVYTELKNARLVAVAEVAEAGKTVAKEAGCAYYKNYEDMLAAEEIDAVSVCVPTSLHYQAARTALQNGVHTLVEKPIAGTVKEAEELVRCARSTGLILMAGHIERFNPAVQKMKELIDQGRLGTITSLLARRVGLFPPQIKDANVITDLAVHDIDVFNYLLGAQPTQVAGRAGTGLITERDDYAALFLHYGAVNALLDVNWITPVKIRVLSVTGTKGYAELDYITQELVLYKSTYERLYDNFGDFVIKFGTAEQEGIPVEKKEPLKNELMHFLDCVENDKVPLVTGDDGLNVLRIVSKVTPLSE